MNKKFSTFKTAYESFNAFAKVLQANKPTVEEINNNFVKASIAYKEGLKKLTY